MEHNNLITPLYEGYVVHLANIINFGAKQCFTVLQLCDVYTQLNVHFMCAAAGTDY